MGYIALAACSYHLLISKMDVVKFAEYIELTLIFKIIFQTSYDYSKDVIL